MPVRYGWARLTRNRRANRKETLMRSSRKQNQDFRESGIGRKHPLENHYADGLKNGTKAVRDNPQHRQWYAVMALSSARGQYASWPPYRAYQLGFARGARTA